MHHKRHRPKQRRSGCLLCKPHKLPATAKAARRRARGDVVDGELELLDQEHAEVGAELAHYFGDD